jgi:hypothetical protein
MDQPEVVGRRSVDLCRELKEAVAVRVVDNHRQAILVRTSPDRNRRAAVVEAELLHVVEEAEAVEIVSFCTLLLLL